MEKVPFPASTIVPDGMQFSPRRIAAKISLGYAAAGWLWILTSDRFVAYLTQDVEMMVLINSMKGSLYVFFTAGILFGLVRHYLKQIYSAQGTIIADAQNLEYAFEELAATDEELRRQYEDAKAQEIRVHRLAYYDTLTGLPNRAMLLKTLQEKLGEATTGTLFYIDVDDLKIYNDSYGHSLGDALLCNMAREMIGIAGNDAVVARIGGDEFVVLVMGLSEPGAIAEFAEDFVRVLSREYDIQGILLHVSASVGIVRFPEDGATVEDVMKNADTALYEAKKHGKRCWRRFHPEMQEITYENLLLTNGLRAAIIKQELALHFQPQISLDHSQVIAFEALLRWNSTKFGSVSPIRFIPLAEKGHLIEEIGFWVLRRACCFARRLNETGPASIRVAVNVSPSQLIAASFLDHVRFAIQEAGIAPSQLEIEITESVLIDTAAESIYNLRELSAMGVRLALDDFGTGYSSLTYLRQLPVNSVKIDKLFIQRITEDSSHAALLEAIIHMSHVLGFSVVAEGVETKEQLAQLYKYRCDIIQGFIVSPAVPEAEAMKWVADPLWKD